MKEEDAKRKIFPTGLKTEEMRVGCSAVQKPGRWHAAVRTKTRMERMTGFKKSKAWILLHPFYLSSQESL